jgi:hypothetical protein
MTMPDPTSPKPAEKTPLASPDAQSPATDTTVVEGLRPLEDEGKPPNGGPDQS